MMCKRMNANARSVVDDCDDVSCTMLVYSRALATQCQTMSNSVSCSSGVSRPDTPPSSLLIRTSAGCISSVLEGQGLALRQSKNDGGRKDDLGFLQRGPCHVHVTNPTKSNRLAHHQEGTVVSYPNAINSGLSVPPAFDPLMSSRHE